MPDVSLWCDVRLGNVPHIFVFGVHIVDVTRGVAAAVFSEVSYLATVEARPLRTWPLIIGLSLSACCIAIFRLGRVHVSIVALVLSSVIWRSSAQ
jgi:hypothetical protein